MISMYTGLPGSGKTTALASIALQKLQTFEKEKKQNTGVKPRLFSNIKFSEQIEDRYSEYINYFEDIYQMPDWTDSEIFIDEAAVYFDSRLWEGLPKNIRRFLFTHRHLGTNLHMIAQDFTTIDNSFRRLTAKLYLCRKLLSTREPSPTRKSSKYPFNLCTINEVEKTHWHLEKEHYTFARTEVNLFTKKHFDIFNTRQKLPEQELPPLRKEVRTCLEDGYTRTQYK